MSSSDNRQFMPIPNRIFLFLSHQKGGQVYCNQFAGTSKHQKLQLADLRSCTFQRCIQFINTRVPIIKPTKDLTRHIQNRGAKNVRIHNGLASCNLSRLLCNIALNFGARASILQGEKDQRPTIPILGGQRLHVYSEVLEVHRYEIVGPNVLLGAPQSRQLHVAVFAQPTGYLKRRCRVCHCKIKDSFSPLHLWKIAGRIRGKKLQDVEWPVSCSSKRMDRQMF